MFRDYTDEQIAKLGDYNFNRLVQRETLKRELIVTVGFEKSAPYNPDKYRWEAEAPKDFHCQQCKEPICLKCCEWRRYGPGQRHFGYTWWGTCKVFSQSCDCEHHKHEVWIA